MLKEDRGNRLAVNGIGDCLANAGIADSAVIGVEDKQQKLAGGGDAHATPFLLQAANLIGWDFDNVGATGLKINQLLAKRNAKSNLNAVKKWATTPIGVVGRQAYFLRRLSNEAEWPSAIEFAAAAA